MTRMQLMSFITNKTTNINMNVVSIDVESQHDLDLVTGNVGKGCSHCSDTQHYRRTCPLLKKAFTFCSGPFVDNDSSTGSEAEFAMLDSNDFKFESNTYTVHLFLFV